MIAWHARWTPSFTQRHSILANIALHVAREFDVPLSEMHYDPTHILFHGAYDRRATAFGRAGRKAGPQ